MNVRSDDPQWQKLCRDGWNQGCSRKEMAEMFGISPRNVTEMLYRTGITYPEMRDRDNPIVEVQCPECSRVFRERAHGAGRRHWCSTDCEAIHIAREHAAKREARTPEELARIEANKVESRKRFLRLKHAILNETFRSLRYAKDLRESEL